MKRRGLWIATITAALVAVVACASLKPPAGTSTEARIAINARQLMAAADGVLTATDAMAQKNLITPTDAVKIFRAMERVGEIGRLLASTLRVVDTAKGTTKVSAARDAERMLREVTDIVNSIPLQTDEPTARARILGALKGILDAAAATRQLLPAGGIA